MAAMTHLFIVEFAYFLFDWVNELHLSCCKPHQQQYTVRGDRG